MQSGPRLSITGFRDLQLELFIHCALSSPSSANITQSQPPTVAPPTATEHNTCATNDEFTLIRTEVSGSWAKRD